jgi:hypothetical protein
MAQKKLDLAHPLVNVQVSEAAPAKADRSIDDVIGGSAVVSHLGLQSNHGFLLNPSEFRPCEETHWKRVSDAGQVNSIIHRLGFLSRYISASDDPG